MKHIDGVSPVALSLVNYPHLYIVMELIYVLPAAFDDSSYFPPESHGRPGQLLVRKKPRWGK